ncbi:MAG: MYXO-CTERM sorting domain-containing protein [Pseudomonadota bacterium]
MRTLLAVALTVQLAGLPLAAWAQEDGGLEDVVVVEDASAAEDAAAGEDSASAEDATTTPDADSVDASPGCGNVPVTGECDGDLMRACEGGEIIEVNCPTNTDIGGPTTTCGLVDCDDQPYPACFGYWCVARAGESCAELPCDVELSHGCVNGVCTVSTACDPATYLATCNGSVTTFCGFGMVSTYDCAANGEPFDCAAPPNVSTSSCIGLEGGECGTYGGTDFLCAEGLTCSGGICTASSVTDAGSGTDATRRDTGASSGDDDDDSSGGSCGCTASRAAPPALLILASLAGLAIVRRRR